jgi:hypothetical protein
MFGGPPIPSLARNLSNLTGGLNRGAATTTNLNNL